MSRHRLLRFAFIAVLSALLPAAPACSSDGTSAVKNISIADVVREGDVTDSQLRAVLTNAAQDWAWAGGSFDAPVAGSTLPKGVPFPFTWESDPTVDPPAAGAADDLQTVHLLVFSSALEPNLLRVFTTLDSYTPDAGAWQTLQDAGERGAITLSLTSATLRGSELIEDGGPFIGQSLSFTIE